MLTDFVGLIDLSFFTRGNEANADLSMGGFGPTAQAVGLVPALGFEVCGLRLLAKVDSGRKSERLLMLGSIDLDEVFAFGGEACERVEIARH